MKALIWSLIAAAGVGASWYVATDLLNPSYAPGSSVSVSTPAANSTTNQGLDCSAYASATDINSIFGIAKPTIKITSQGNNGCRFYWTAPSPNSEGVADSGSFYVWQNNQSQITLINDNCGGNSEADKNIIQGLHSEYIGDTSCYYNLGTPAPFLDFTKGEYAVSVSGDVFAKESQMMSLAGLIEGNLSK